MDVLENIKQSIELLDNVEKYYEELPTLQSNVDCALSDLYHCIENRKLKTDETYRIVKEIRKQRLNRRKLNNDYELLKTFKTHENKLMNSGSRKMLTNEMHKTNNRLNQPYKNRIYTDEKINEILGGKKCKGLKD